MPIDVAHDLLDSLRLLDLLDPVQIEQFGNAHKERLPSAGAAIEELRRRGWLTAYQADEVLKGRGQELILGPYAILDLLGKGGMGEVFKARHVRLKRIVAIKIIRPDHLHCPEAVQRFLREAREAAQLQHPNIVTLYDANQQGHTHYIAMEYVQGTDLAVLIRQIGPLAPALACDYACQAAHALQHAHERGLVHRDIKPSNLVVTQLPGRDAGSVLKVLDFGLARFVSELMDEKGLTPTDEWLGTPDYIAPEQARNSRLADIRADIFSLGCSLFHMLTGQAAFPGSNRTEKLAARLEMDALPVQAFNPAVSSDLASILARMLARNPDHRFQTPAEVAAALMPLSRDEGASQPRGPALAEQPLSNTRDTAPYLPDTMPYLPDTSRVRARDEPQRSPRRRGLWLLAVAVACLLALGAFFGMEGFERLLQPHGEPPAPGRDVHVQPNSRFTNSLSMTFVRIPAGEFLMGSPNTEEGRGEDESPQHKVRIGKAFYLGACEVTQGEYELLMKDNPSWFSPTGPGREKVGQDTARLPVEQVSWTQAVDFCRKLSELPEEREARCVYRLPTEAEWEYACRAGTGTPFHTGGTLAAEQASFNALLPYGGLAPGLQRRNTTPVGAFLPNVFGLYDMHGNVGEWCQDWYGPYTTDAQTDPQGPDRPGHGLLRVMRGGGWDFNAASCRAAKRHPYSPVSRHCFLGLRVVYEHSKD